LGEGLILHRFAVFLPLPFLLVFADLSHSQSVLDSLAIVVMGESREFAYTNKEAAYFYGETNGEHRSSWQGFNVWGHEFLDDYKIFIDGVQLDRAKALKTTVYPDYLVRMYPGGIIEELRPVDSLAMFTVCISGETPAEVGIRPYFTDINTDNQAEVQLVRGIAFIARKSHLIRTPNENYPVWLAMRGEGFTPLRKNDRQGNQFSPLSLQSARTTRAKITFAVADTRMEAERILAMNIEVSSVARRKRMENLLRLTEVRTGDVRFDKALAWGKLSLDALIMHQGSRGIFAGLPWFNSYWGRDTFISLPGATFVTGQYSLAKEILRSFAEFQQKDTASPDDGRIPNIVTPRDTAYNTADGTPRFIMMAKEYVERSGDSAFIHEIYPTVLRSIEGTLRYHTDASGFLTHGDAETWMDAVGPDGPWSPRGNRANDVQALWAEQLEAGAWFADQVKDSKSAFDWRRQRKKLLSSFMRHFVVNGVIVDHLNADGSADSQLRPNQIFTAPLFGETGGAMILRSVVEKMTYEYGVASLSQDDESFHPFHVNPPFYPKDAAYHNGTVWTWLQGQVISELCKFEQQDLAYRLTTNTVRQILDRGAVGTQSELLDAVPRDAETEPRLSGTFSQAWNLAEFIRNFYDDYLGVRVNRFTHELLLRPHLPDALHNVYAVINLDGRSVPITVTRHDSAQTEYFVDATNLKVGGTGRIDFKTAEGNPYGAKFPILPGVRIRVIVRDSTIRVFSNEGFLEGATYRGIHAHPVPKPDFSGMQFATARIRPELRSLKGPAYALLSHEEIKSVNPKANVVFEIEDPQGDDDGGKGHTYPLHPAFVPGSLDITGLRMVYDRNSVGFEMKFRALSNPGWHPEYGFQLTYVAIALDQDGQYATGKQVIEHNSNYTLPNKKGFERLILVGGGVQVENEAGTVLAAYIPSEADIDHPLGNAAEATISFAIPLTFLGRPDSSWKFTVLVGAQDDHGGSGLGEFRTVGKEPSEWSGGGKTAEADPNVYDILVAPLNR
jgi:glycogen debranching enzyme